MNIYEILTIFGFLVAMLWLGITFLFFLVYWIAKKDTAMGVFTIERIIEMFLLCSWFRNWI